jgi:hypothetical protein
LIALYEDSPQFVDDVEFSGEDGNILRKNAIFLDGIVQQPVSVFTHGIGPGASDGMGRNSVTLIMPRVWWGAFQYRAGINEAVYAVSGTPVTNERIRIYHKPISVEVTNENAPGTLVYDAVWPSVGTGITIDISSAGYTDGDIIEVVIQVYFPGPSYPKTGIYQVRNAFTQPITSFVGLSSYPGLPTFSGSSITAAQLNQLSNAQDWLMTRLSLVPRVPFINGMFVNGTHKSTTANNNNPMVLHYSWINKGNGQDTFHGVIDYYIFNGEEVVRVYVNNVLKYTSAALTNGQKGTLDFTFDISSLTDGNDYLVRVEQYVTLGQGQADLGLYGNMIINSRYTIRVLEATSTRSYFSPSSAFDIRESMTFATLKARLNNFKTGTNNVYTAINGSTIFNRARMFRKKVGVDDHQNTVLDNESLPMQVRIGDRYVVAGKDVKIAWGGYSITKSMQTDPTANDIFEFANVENLTGSDKVEVKEGFFEEFKSIFPGTTYYILGKDVVFFSEYLR